MKTEEHPLSTTDALSIWEQIFITNSNMEDYFKHYMQEKELYIHYSFIQDNHPTLFPDIYNDTINESVVLLANQALQSLEFKNYPKAQEGYVRFSDNTFLDGIAIDLHKEMVKESKSKKIESAKKQCVDVFYLDERGRRCINYETLLNTLLEKHTFKTLSDTEQVLVYEKGIYKDATVLIKGFVEDMLGTDATSYIVHEQIGHVQRRFYTDRELFNSNKDYIPVKNGLLNLKTFQLERFNPDMMYRFKLPGKFDESATYEATERFFADVLHEEDIPILQEFFGYCLIADLPAHKMMWFIGEGHNGKTTTAKLLQALIGKSNTSNVQLNELDGEHRFAYVGLYGKLLNIVSEPPTRFGLQTPLIKAATGGDTLRGEIKGVQTPINFMNFAKFLVYANSIPHIYDSSEAFWNRTIAINYPNQFIGGNETKDIEKEIIEMDGLEGLLNWALIGLKRLAANNFEFTPSKWQKTTIGNMKRSSQPIETFISEWCSIEDPNSEISKDALYLAYQEYGAIFKLRVMSYDAFDRSLRRAAPVTAERTGKRGSRIRIWRGITLIKEEKMGEGDKEKNSMDKKCTQQTQQTRPPLSHRTDTGNRGLNEERSKDYHMEDMSRGKAGLQGTPGTSRNQNPQHALCELCGKIAPLTEIKNGGISVMACGECVKTLKEKSRKNGKPIENQNPEKNIQNPDVPSTCTNQNENDDMFITCLNPRANDESFQIEQSKEAKKNMEQQLSKTHSKNASLIDIMHKIEVDFGQEIPVFEIMTKAEEAGITHDEAEEVIALMKQDGVLFSPTKGVVKFVR